LFSVTIKLLILISFTITIFLIKWYYLFLRKLLFRFFIVLWFQSFKLWLFLQFLNFKLNFFNILILNCS
jgi:hypothetical protein